MIIREGIQGKGVFIIQPFKKGAVLFVLEGPLLDYPTRTSIQVGKNKHIEDKLGAFINHSCQPSAVVDWQGHALISLRDLMPGEEITFDYSQNETELASPFTCGCCGRKMLGKVHKKEKEI